MDGGALFAGRMGGVRGVGQARPGLARVVVELHEAEDQVGGHELELVRRVCDHVPAEQNGRMKLVGGGGSKMERRQHQTVRGADLTRSDLRYRFVHELGILR